MSSYEDWTLCRHLVNARDSSPDRAGDLESIRAEAPQAPQITDPQRPLTPETGSASELQKGQTQLDGQHAEALQQRLKDFRANLMLLRDTGGQPSESWIHEHVAFMEQVWTRQSLRTIEGAHCDDQCANHNLTPTSSREASMSGLMTPISLGGIPSRSDVMSPVSEVRTRPKLATTPNCSRLPISSVRRSVRYSYVDI